MADNPDDGVKINLISSRKLDSMSSQEKLRFILDQVKSGTVLVLERGLTAVEEIDLIKSTMSEIDHETFIGIEMQSYSAEDLTGQNWFSKILGRTRVPKMSVIGPANLLKTIQKNGNIIQAMILTGKSVGQGLPSETTEGDETETGVMLTDGELPEDIDSETAETEPGTYESEEEQQPIPTEEPEAEHEFAESSETEYDEVFEPDQPVTTEQTQLEDITSISPPAPEFGQVELEPAAIESEPETEPEQISSEGETSYETPVEPEAHEEYTQESPSGGAPEQSTYAETDEQVGEQEDVQDQSEEQETKPAETESESETEPDSEPDSEKSVGFLYKRLKTEEE
jgi:hypothetical protein